MAASTTQQQASGVPQDAEPTEFVILGSGVSTAIPRISCIIRPRTERGACPVCHDALANPESKNRRCNVSALVRAGGRTVLIDIGKTAREAAMRHFPKLGVQDVDAIVLTHGHADAILGLDDVRDIQVGAARHVDGAGKPFWIPGPPTPVFLNEDTMAVCRSMFPYLVPKEQLCDERAKQDKDKDIKRAIASLRWEPYGEDSYFEPFRPVADAPIEFTPIPLLHGGSYVCMGFVIRVGRTDADLLTPDECSTVVYLSDLHELPARSRAHITALGRIDLLVIDMLTLSDFNRSHLSRAQAQELVRELAPVQAVAVGMTCSLGLHDEVNESLARAAEEEGGVPFRLSYDGERFPL